MNLALVYDKIESKLQQHFNGSVLRNSNLINRKDTVYPAVAFDLQSIIDNDETSNYTFEFYLCTKMNSDFTQIEEHYNELIERFKLFLIDIESKGLIVNYPITYQTNSLKFADVLDVVNATVSFTVNNDVDCM